ncbi:cytochrome c [Polyangium aurulentum]|uniref:cytochrome c n=1 Tax=Polyangium aurulentum TaxID=2567896 RepID=UPI0010AEB1B9|nr:cytochrome c [Polyangium aurulentum]UQA59261.1 cytochrome c [Polyangium aurulentum]
MRARLGSSLAANDSAALATALETTARLVPDPSWTSWATFARTGANAARRGDMAGARAACKGCHDAYRAEYREKHRLRPVPPG